MEISIIGALKQTLYSHLQLILSAQSSRFGCLLRRQIFKLLIETAETLEVHDWDCANQCDAHCGVYPISNTWKLS